MSVDLIRVKQHETGHELTIPRSMYDFAPDAYDELDKPATDAGGDPLPPKHKTTVKKAAEQKARPSGQQADQEES